MSTKDKILVPLMIIFYIVCIVYWYVNYVNVERKPLPVERGWEQEECVPNYMGGCD